MFASRVNMVMDTNLLHTHFQQFGMFMHVGSCTTETSEGSESKTEAVYIPCTEIPVDEIYSNSAGFDLICDSGGLS